MVKPIHFNLYFFSDIAKNENVRPISEGLSFSISRLLSKNYENQHSNLEKEDDIEVDIIDKSFSSNHRNFCANTVCSYPIYSSSHILRIPTQRSSVTPMAWTLPNLHSAALAHQAVKERLAGKLFKCNFYIYIYNNTFFNLYVTSRRVGSNSFVKII